MIVNSKSYKMGDKVFNTLPELEMARKFEVVDSFTTTDGKIFKFEYEAKEHQDSLAPHRVELKDLFNKILILIEQNKDKSDSNYLENIRSYIEKVTDSPHEASIFEEQYYNSNCY